MVRLYESFLIHRLLRRSVTRGSRPEITLCEVGPILSRVIKDNVPRDSRLYDSLLYPSTPQEYFVLCRRTRTPVSSPNP